MFFINDEIAMNNFKESINLKDNDSKLKYITDFASYIINDIKLFENLLSVIFYSSGIYGEKIRNIFINILEYNKNEESLILISNKTIYESYLLNINLNNSIEHIIYFVKNNKIKSKDKAEDYISDIFIYLIEIILKKKLSDLKFEEIHQSQITELVGLSSNFYGLNISKISFSFLEDYIHWLKINTDKNILNLDIDEIKEYKKYIKNNKCVFRDCSSYANFMEGIYKKFEYHNTLNKFTENFNKMCI